MQSIVVVLLVLLAVVNTDENNTQNEAPLHVTAQSSQHKSEPEEVKLKRDILKTVHECSRIGLKEGKAICAHSEDLHKNGYTLKRGTPEYNHFQNTFSSIPTDWYEKSLGILGATRAFRSIMGPPTDSSPNTFTDYLLNLGYVPGPYKECAPQVVCTTSKYRSMDGSCNNKQFVRWGQSGTAFNRLKSPSYSDGVHAPRKSVMGHELPLAREVSGVLFDDYFAPDHEWTVLLMQFGQYLSHDMSLAQSVSYGGEGIECCNPDKSSKLPPELMHHACYPIIIPKYDPFYSHFGQGCMNFVRTMTAPHPDCRLAPAEQMNAVTHWIDASQVYGSTTDQSKSLRIFKNGLLDYQIRNGKVVPPTIGKDGEDGIECDSNCPAQACYKGGDVRLNQNLGLASIHILFLRFHNWVVTELYKINPHWDDEKLYQEGRRLCIGVYQQFVYYEYLPIILGWDFCAEHNIIVHGDQYGSKAGFNPYVSPNILNEHATAAFRYQHSTIHGFSELIDDYRHLNGTTRLSDHMNCPALLEGAPHLLNYYINGMITSPMQKADQFFTHEVTWFLFRSGKPFGLDLESFDVQRGRDHGLRPYNDYRELCGLPRAYDFHDLLDVMSPEVVDKLSSLYASVDDLDLMTAFLERHVKDALFGPTLRCIVGEQFYRSRVADSFFFEHKENCPYPFTDRQLHAIKNFKLSKFICQNADYMEEIQPEALRLISKENPLVPCHSLPEFDMFAWQDGHY